MWLFSWHILSYEPISSQYSSNQIQSGEHSRFYRFCRQKTEAPKDLAIYIFADLLLDFKQYFHKIPRLLVGYMMCLLTTSLLTLTSLQPNCVHALLPNALIFICMLTSPWLVRLFCAKSTGLFAVAWCCTLIHIHFNNLYYALPSYVYFWTYHLPLGKHS